MLVRPWCGDKARIQGSCPAIGADVDQMQQYSGITRFDGDSASFLIDLGEPCPINALVLSKTNLSPNALFKIEASNSIAGLNQKRASFFTKGSEVHKSHEFPISQLKNEAGHKVNHCGCRINNKSCDRKLLGQDWDDLSISELNGESFYFSTGPLLAYCEEEIKCLNMFENCTYEPDLIWVDNENINLKARFVRVSIYDEGNDCIDLSRLFIGEAFQGDCNVSNNWGIRVIDDSEIKRSRSGTAHIGCGRKYRCFTGRWELQSERFFNEMFKADMKFGKGQEVFVITQPEKTCDRHLTSFWGVPDDTRNFTLPQCDSYTTDIKLIEARGFF